MSYTVYRSQNFDEKVRDAVKWIRENNQENFSEEFAEKRVNKLKKEIEDLIDLLSEHPGRPPAISKKNPDTRAKAVFDGRYQCVWVIDESLKQVWLTDFNDLKYPEILRYADFKFDD